MSQDAPVSSAATASSAATGPRPGADAIVGLTERDAAQRLAVDGPNLLAVDQRRGLAALAGEVVREPMFLLLLGAGAVYLLMGERNEALVLLGFVLIIMLVTVLQERRTEHALDALRELSGPRAQVLRDGQLRAVPGHAVVRGDVLMLAEGDRVAADGELLQAHELALDESLLTGESEPVAKGLPSADARPVLVYAGTLVVAGQGVIRVIATGRRTELGAIGQSLQHIALQASPLQQEIARLTRRLTVVGVSLSLLLSLLVWSLRADWLSALLAGITLAMSVLPQELPVILIVFLALGARRLAQQQVLTRRLNAIETLGETTLLCVDKTGTLTENRMQVSELWAEGQSVVIALPPPVLLADPPAFVLSDAHAELLQVALLASETAPHDPMERALHGLADEVLAEAQALHRQWSLLREYELSPELRAMSHLWRIDADSHDVVASKGAPEAMAELCHLPPSQRERIAQQTAEMASRGLRVLGVARARHPQTRQWPEAQHDFDFVFLGLVGLADPLRAEVPAAVAECGRAGIRVVMITGDHPQTARAIALRAGIPAGQVLTGAELAEMDAITLLARVQPVQVFARVSPQQKLALVQAFKTHGEVVAMTGDGVNDAPALKAAHIGIAMGGRGTEVAREAASLVLLNDQFSAILGAIRLGRRIFANLRQAMVYTLAVHLPIVALSILPLLLGLPALLGPIHIAFLELLIAPIGSLLFESNPAHPQLMQEPPRSARESLLTPPQLLLSLAMGSVVSLVVLLFYRQQLQVGLALPSARAAAFALLVLASVLMALPLRSIDTHWRSMFVGLGGVAVGIAAGSVLALMLALGLPGLAGAFGFALPSFKALALCLLLALCTLLLLSLLKQWLGLKAEGGRTRLPRSVSGAARGD